VKKRRLLLGLGSLGVLALAGWLVWITYLVCSGGYVTAESYERIREGMTQREVEALLGGPADESGEVLHTGPPDPEPTIDAWWYGNTVAISVWFYRGRVCYKKMRDRRPDEGGDSGRRVLDRLRRLVPW
jgi:hypothetical protein